MDIPTVYSDICEKAFQVQEDLKLTDVQLLLYNHICRGDFYLRNEDGQLFYDVTNRGFGCFGNRNWVKKEMSKIVKSGLVKFESLKDCRSKRYTSWVWYDSEYNYSDLINASCYVKAHRIFDVKHHLGLEDGFEKRNVTYGDLELIYNDGNLHPYQMKWKGDEDRLFFDPHKAGAIYSNTDYFRCYETFGEMIHQINHYLCRDGKRYMDRVPNTTTIRHSLRNKLIISRKQAETT